MKLTHHLRRVVLLALAFAPSNLWAQDVEPVTADRMKAVEKVMGWQAPPVGAPALEATPSRQVIRVVNQMGEDGKPSPFVEVLEYDYPTGSAHITTINVQTGDKKTRVVENAAPALADDEKARALAIAKSLPEVASLYLGGKPEEDLRPVLIQNAASPLARHRIVDLFLKGPAASGTRTLVALRVDLTAKQIVPQSDGAKLRVRTVSEPPQPPAASPVQGQAAPFLDDVIEQTFPAGRADWQTAWRVRFGTVKHNGNGLILYVKSAEYKPSRDAPEWIPVLGDTRLAEIYVPYNDGVTAFPDIGMGFGLTQIDESYLGPTCLGQIERPIRGNLVALELHDAGVLWIDNQNRVARNQRLDLWAVLGAGNYRYIMQYSFHSDGSIACYLGPTAHNLLDSYDDIETTHVHLGCWRITPKLGDPKKLAYKTIRYQPVEEGTPVANPPVPFANGAEGGEVWTAEHFTTTRFESTALQNDHDPKHYMSYDLVPLRFGSLRRKGPGVMWLANDTWVTHEKETDGSNRYDYMLVDQYAGSQRSLEGESCVIWHQSGFVHRTRDEDFGPVGADASGGSAVVNYVGFMLKPRNVHRSTPHHPVDAR